MRYSRILKNRDIRQASRILTSIGLAALLSIALVPTAVLAGAQQAWAEESVGSVADFKGNISQSVADLGATMDDNETPHNPPSITDSMFDKCSEAIAVATEKPLTRTSRIAPRDSYNTIPLTDGKQITTTFDFIAMADYTFSLGTISFVELSLNVYDYGYDYYKVGMFGLFDSADNLIDIVWVDHNDEVDAGWILPAGSYRLNYLGGNEQTVTVGYNIVESGTSQHQMVSSDSRGFEKAGNIAIGGNTVLGVLFWGITHNDGQYLDGHYYKINVTKKSSLDIVLAGYGTTGLGIYNAEQRLLQSIQTSGTSRDPDSASLRTATLDPGTYYIVVLCDDSWAFSKPYQFSVKYATQPIVSASVSVKSKTYNGKVQKPAVTVKMGGQTLKAGRDYTVSCKAGKNVGSYKVTVTGKGSYTGTKTATFKINPKGTSVKKLKKAKRGFAVTWKKPSKANLKQTTGYQVRWSLKKSMKGAKTKTVKATTKAGKKCTLKVSKLKGGKKYYVQVRTYKKTGGKTDYSSWSKAKTVKIKK